MMRHEAKREAMRRALKGLKRDARASGLADRLPEERRPRLALTIALAPSPEHDEERRPEEDDDEDEDH
jgi:hypothetical protein